MADAPPADALFGDADDDVFGAATSAHAASGLFDADPQQQKPVHDSSTDIAGVFGALSGDAADPFASVGTGAGASGSADAGANSVLDDYASQGWYDDDGKFHLYEDPAESYVAPATTTSTTTHTQTKSYTPNAYAPTSHTPQTTRGSYAPPAADSGYAPPPAASGPYAPPATNAHAPQANKYAPPPTNAYAPPANAYTPPTNHYTSTNAYTPSTNSSAPSTNTYAPSTNSYTPSTNTYAPPVKAYAPPPPPSSYAPPPPAAYTSAAPPPSGYEHLKYRSASANAYDPPIPAARRRFDSTASSASAGSPALTGPFGQTTFSPAQPAYGHLGHGAPPPPAPGPPHGRNRVGSQGSVLSSGAPQRTLSPADALGPGRVGSPLAGPARVGSPLVRSASPYDPPAPAAGSTASPVAGPGASAHPPPAPPKQSYGPPPATGTKSAFDPPPPRTGTKSAFDSPLTGRKNAFDPPLTGRKNAFDPPLTGRKNAFDPPPPRTGTKSAFDPPTSRTGPPPMQRQASHPHHGAPPPMTPNLGVTGSMFAPPPRPKSAYDPPPARPASGAGGRYGPGLDTSSSAAPVGPRSAPGEEQSSADMDGRGSLDGADSGYKSRTSMSSERAWMDEAGGADPEGGVGEQDPEGGSGPRIEEMGGDPEGDPEGGANEYDEAADRTLVAPLLGIVGPKITATAPTPIASPGRTNVEFEDPEGGESPYVPAALPRTASPSVISRTAPPAAPPAPPAARTMSRTTSVSSTSESPYGHKMSPSISKRPAPVVVEPPQAGKYVVDTQPYTPMYGASPYSDVQTSPPKKLASADPYAPTNKPADPYAPTNKPAADPYAPMHKPATDPFAPAKAAEPHPPSKFTGGPTQRVTYSPPNGLARVYTPPPARNGTLSSRKSSLASVKDAYAPAKDPYAPPAPAKDAYAPPNKDPYAPSTNADHYAPPKAMPRDIKRPASTAYDPPMPAVPQQPHASSYTPGVPAQMYAPRRDSRAQDHGDASDYEGSGGYVSRYNYSSVDPYQPNGTPAAYVPVNNGTDPLGRHDSRAPVIVFGFGGRLITSFPGLSELTGGFDVSLGRKAAPIQIRTLHKIIPESAVENSTAVFPGPLFSDPGSPTKSLVSVAAGGSGAKTKKVAVIKYLGERAEEIERGLGYLAVDAGVTPGPSERSKAEGKLVLVLLLKIMVESDGKLSGTPAIDAAVRHALVPRLASAPTITSPNSQTASFSLASTLDVTISPPSSHLPSSSDSPVATYKIKPAALDKIQEFLLQGERRAAYHYALDERMWAHAMLISSSLDKEAWKEVVNEFIRAELGVRTDQKKPAPFGGDPSVANGREPLRVAYSLFAGQGAAAMQELLPPKNLARAGVDSLMPPTMSMMHATPISPNFPQPVLTSNVPAPALLQWQEIAATILSNQGDSSALTALGDYLISNNYLLSPATSPVGGISTPSVRMVLLGSESPSVSRNFEKDDDAIIFTEIAEYAHSLPQAVKGQEAYAGVPHLQAYKLIRAARLTEMGHLSLATRYCEAIATSTRTFGRPSPFFTPCFVEQCKELNDRLSGVPQLDGSGSWISKKGGKPSLDSIGTWITGGLTKLIAGDGEEVVSPPSDQGPKAESGAFSHYSAISSANTSQTPSPNASVVGLPPTQPGIPPPRRSGSAMARPGSAAALRNGTHHHPHPTDRASSAMDHLRPPANKSSPFVPTQAFSASAATTTFYQADIGYRAGVQEPAKMSAVEEDPSTGSSSGTYTPWWGGADESSGPTPTATTFFRVEDAPESADAGGGEGFVSLMDTFSPMPSPALAASSSFRSTPHPVEDEDEEDLGFGNSKRPKGEEKTDDESDKDKGKGKVGEKKKEEEPKKDPKEAAKGPELKPATSWIGRWWSRKESDSPGPVKANLGEQMSLVYDKELKRWINPNAPKPDPVAAPPPPPSRTPSRTQTSSPGPGPGPSPLGRTSVESTPPTRPQSANGLAPPPSGGSTGPRRARSTLNESFGPGGDISSSNEGSRTSTPPTSVRGQTPAGKRNIRSRYVDVFAEPPPSPST